jgi:nucleotide-binding universal stress UspA family protein
MYTRILLPLDGSKTAEQVIPWARILAERFRMPVELLAVIDLGRLLTSVEGARRFDALVEQSARQGKAYLERISGRFVGNPVTRSVERGAAAELIIERAAADKSILVAMTTHGRSGLERWLLGSVAEKVLRGSTNPLLLVRAAPGGRTTGEATLKSILLPLDGSQVAEQALPTAAKLAAKLDLEVFLFRAYANPFTAFVGGSGPYAVNVDELMKQVREEAGAYLEQARRELSKQGIEKISCVLQEGDAAEQIVAAAKKGPDTLIVIGSHGRSGLKRWALGSVTEAVVRHASNPVLVLRPGSSH